VSLFCAPKSIKIDGRVTDFTIGSKVVRFYATQQHKTNLNISDLWGSAATT